MILPVPSSHCSSSPAQQFVRLNGASPPAREGETCARRLAHVCGDCRRYMSVLWRLDVLSLATVLLLLVLSRLLPPQLATILLAVELAFGVITVPRRCQRLDTIDQPKANSSSADADQDAALWLQGGEQVLQQLLNSSEALLWSDGGWFWDWWAEGACHPELGRSNVAQFLSYIAFSGPSTDAAAQRLQSDSFIAALGLDISSDHNPKATFVSHTQEPLKARYRPLTFYLLTEAVAGISHLQLTARQGFRLARKTLTATYYVRPAQPGAPAQPPLVFLHGIGLGLAPYTAFIRRLAAQHPDRTVVAVQYRHVSMRLTTHIPTATEVSDDVAAFLASAGFPRANVVAHSYGTLVASGLAKRHSSLLAGLTLVDPVCFAMFLPHLVVNTLHFDAVGRARRLQVKGGVAVPALSLRRLMKGLVLREMHCAAAMSRRLRWPEVNLWLSEVPANTAVYLSGMDNMIPVAEIHQLLTSPAAAARGIQVTYTPEHGHGAFLLHPKLQQVIITGSSVAADSGSGRASPGLCVSTGTPLAVAGSEVLAAGAQGTGSDGPLGSDASDAFDGSDGRSSVGVTQAAVVAEARVPRWRRRRAARAPAPHPTGAAGKHTSGAAGEGLPQGPPQCTSQPGGGRRGGRPAFRRPLLLRPLMLMHVLRTVPWARPFRRRRAGAGGAAGADVAAVAD